MEVLLNIGSKFFAIIKQFGVILLYFISIILVQGLFLKASLSDNIFILTTSSILVELIVLIIFIFLFRKTIIPDFYDYKKNFKQIIKSNYKYWIYGLVIMVISNFVIGNFIGMPVNEEINQSLLIKLPVYSFITMIMIAPIIEELMTRVILKNNFNRYVYATLSGLFFGSLHLLSITSFIEVLYIIPYGVLGFFFAIMYSNTNNIWTSITFHSLHNLIALLLFFIGA